MGRWNGEDCIRDKASLYGFDNDGHLQLRVWGEANKHIEEGDTPELSLIVDKVKEIAKVRDERELIESMGVHEDESGSLSIVPLSEPKSRTGSLSLLVPG